MNFVAIPNWDGRQVLPPHDYDDPVSSQRSPYRVSLAAFVERFSTSLARCEILRGLMGYRARFHAVGTTVGFQWLDGSFLENAEMLLGRPPGDIDVVTFLENPEDSAVLPPELADRPAMKLAYHVDCYFVELAFLNPTLIVEQSTYWYSMWSHNRSLTWKGFVAVDLAPAEDAAASAILESRTLELRAVANAQKGGS